MSSRATKGIPPVRFSPKAYQVTAREPSSYQEVLAMPEPEKQVWLGATKKEYDLLQQYEAFTWTKAPESTSIVDCKCLFKQKNLSSGETLHKARLVARGFSQVYGTDYEQVHPLTVCSETLKVALPGRCATNVCSPGRYIHCVPPCIFGGGDLHEANTWGFEHDNELVLKLQKALYGLR